MKRGAPDSFAVRLKALRERAGYTQEELATIAGLSVHAISALERGERRRPHVDTVRSLCAALDLPRDASDALLASARAPIREAAVDELSRTALPRAPTALVGREHELDELLGWLDDPAARPITLVGPGGVGKTRLALEVAHTLDERGATRVAFVPLAAVQDPAFVAAAVAEAMGLADVEAPDLPARVHAASADQATLLVLDNCEHLPDLSPLVADVLAAAVRIRILATSRAPLHLRGERQYAVTPLAVAPDPGAASLGDSARAPAIRLFLERVRDVQPGFRLTPANVGTVQAICRRLDALPLALELAAPWTKVLTIDGLLERLEHDALFATLAPHDLPDRQQTMNAAVAWSCTLLAADERVAFRRFGVLPGTFPVEAAAAVLAGSTPDAGAADALAAIAALIDKSLLMRADGASEQRPLYRMFETVRAYAQLELSAAGEHDEALAGLARHCADEVTSAVDGLGGPAQGEWLDRIRDDVESYRAILDWLIARGRHDDAADIAWGIGLFFLIRGHTTEGLHWYRRILAGPELTPRAHAKALVGAGLMHWAKGEFAPARDVLLRALAAARDAGAADIVLHADSVMGHVDSAAGNLDAARERYARSVDGYRAQSLTWGVGTSLNGLAGVALASGDLQQAERLLDAAADVLKDAGPWFLTPVLCLRAVLAIGRGDADGAIALMRVSLTHIRALQDKFAFVYAVVPLAAAAVLKRDYLSAAHLLGARDAVAESTGAVIVDSVVQPLRAMAEGEARRHLGAGWAAAYAAGRTDSIDALLSGADSLAV